MTDEEVDLAVASFFERLASLWPPADSPSPQDCLDARALFLRGMPAGLLLEAIGDVLERRPASSRIRFAYFLPAIEEAWEEAIELLIPDRREGETMAELLARAYS